MIFEHVLESPNVSLSFLVSQFGSHAAQCFARELSKIGLRVQDAGLLRMLDANPGMTQVETADTLGVLPSRLVILIDGLEQLGLVERRRDASDRRKIRIFPTVKGGDAARTVAELTRSMEGGLFRALRQDENRLLEQLLRKLAVDQGLRPGVHPAFPEVLGKGDTTE